MRLKPHTRLQTNQYVLVWNFKLALVLHAHILDNQNHIFIIYRVKEEFKKESCRWNWKCDLDMRLDDKTIFCVTHFWFGLVASCGRTWVCGCVCVDWPSVKISQRRMPYDHTSLRVVYKLWKMLSGAIHFKGRKVWTERKITVCVHCWRIFLYPRTGHWCCHLRSLWRCSWSHAWCLWPGQSRRSWLVCPHRSTHSWQQGHGGRTGVQLKKRTLKIEHTNVFVMSVWLVADLCSGCFPFKLYRCWL